MDIAYRLDRIDETYVAMLQGGRKRGARTSG